MHRDAGEWRHGGGIDPSAISRGGNGDGGAFHNSIIDNLNGLSTWNNFIAAIRAPRKFRM